MEPSRPRRAGDAIEDFCRACKTDRMHTIVAVDAASASLRVVCGYCGSEHHFRGGPRIGSVAAAPSGAAPRERIVTSMTPPTSTPADGDLEAVLRRVIREELGLTDAALAERWRGGTLVLRPGKAGVQEKSWPIDTFFHKVVMLRNRLRNLEQHVNASELPDDAKVKLQSYITGCYGSLTSFNVLFGDTDDQFKGTGGD